MRWSVLGVALAVSACAPAMRHFPPQPELTALLEKRVRDRQAIGIAVGVVEADGSTRTAFAGSAGEGARTLGGHSGFEIGSITKTFTGILLAEMVRTGEVRFDDPVSRHLPEGVRVPSRGGQEITLLDLATHHSRLPGMPDNLAPADRSNPLADYTVEQMYAFLARHELSAEPGTAYWYSNIGYGLLGHVLSRAAKMPYEDLVRARILKPLGMRESAINLRGPLRESMTRGHNARGFVVPYWDLPAIPGAGAFRTSLDDAVRFLAANLREPKTGLDRAMRDAQQQRHAVVDTLFNRRGTHGIGLGWQIRSEGGSRIVWKDGGTGGYQTFIGFDPERRVGVVVLSNTAIEVDDIGFHLIDPRIPLESPPPIPVRVSVPEAVLRRYVGEYTVDPEISIGIRMEGGDLYADVTSAAPVRLLAESEASFFIEPFPWSFEFVRNAAGTVDGVVLNAGGTIFRGRRVR